MIEEELFHDLELMGRLFESKSILQFGVKKSEPLLVSILDKALASITIEEEKTIARTWLDGNNDELILSPREKDWLAEHKTIRMAIDHSRPPIAFFYENGIFQEMSSDYINKIEKILGINFKQVKINNLLAVTDGSVKRDVDLFPCLVKTMEREKYLNFTDIYLSIPVGIFSKKDSSYLMSFEELDGEKIGVIKGQAIGEKILRQYPGFNFQRYLTIEEMIKGL